MLKQCKTRLDTTIKFMVVVTSLFNPVISSFPNNSHVLSCMNNAVDLSWWFQQRCSSLFVHQTMDSLFRLASSAMFKLVSSTMFKLVSSAMFKLASSTMFKLVSSAMFMLVSSAMFKLVSSTMFKLVSSTMFKPVNRQKQAVRSYTCTFDHGWE